jgi:acyl carrier protein
MTKHDFLLDLDALLETAPGTLQGTEALDDLLWDSLSVISFIALLVDRFDYNVPPKLLAQCKTVGDLLALVEDRLAPVAAN